MLHRRSRECVHHVKKIERYLRLWKTCSAQTECDYDAWTELYEWDESLVQ